jgi:hypothetical protein
LNCYQDVQALAGSIFSPGLGTLPKFAAGFASEEDVGMEQIRFLYNESVFLPVPMLYPPFGRMRSPMPSRGLRGFCRPIMYPIYVMTNYGSAEMDLRCMVVRILGIPLDFTEDDWTDVPFPAKGDLPDSDDEDSG